MYSNICIHFTVFLLFCVSALFQTSSTRNPHFGTAARPTTTKTQTHRIKRRKINSILRAAISSVPKSSSAHICSLTSHIVAKRLPFRQFCRTSKSEPPKKPKPVSFEPFGKSRSVIKQHTERPLSQTYTHTREIKLCMRVHKQHTHKNPTFVHLAGDRRHNSTRTPNSKGGLSQQP